MGQQSSKGKKGCRKAGRNKVFCQNYRSTNRREKNKLRYLAKHMVHHPMDLVAGKAADKCRYLIKGYTGETK